MSDRSKVGSYASQYTANHRILVYRRYDLALELMPLRPPQHVRLDGSSASRHRAYDRSARNKESKRFYASSAWQRLRQSQLNDTPQCEECWKDGRLVEATVVHHLTEVTEDPGAGARARQPTIALLVVPQQAPR